MYMDVTIAGKGYTNSSLCSANMAFGPGGRFYRAIRAQTRDLCLLGLSGKITNLFRGHDKPRILRIFILTYECCNFDNKES